MGRARARASQIYCVVRPERNAVKRECNVVRPTGASKFLKINLPLGKIL